MKILKTPGGLQFPVKKECRCGCVFEFESEDINIKTTTYRSLEGDRNVYIALDVNCPFCGNVIELRSFNEEN